MSTRTLDRQASSLGGFPYVAKSAAHRPSDALLALADGTIWSGRRLGPPEAIAGAVSLAGEAVLVGEVGVLIVGDWRSLRNHFLGLSAAGEGERLRGCITAAGATTPVHAAVALAVARGEIGRP